jgi:uncharacterized protein YjbI with pentapeptide repeats
MSTKSVGGRWRTTEGRQLAEEVLGRLVTGRSLSDLVSEERDGRVDLRGLPLPSPARKAQIAVGGAGYQVIDGMIEMRGVRWEGLDLSHARLSNLRLSSCVIVDCVLDSASCRDWRLWASEVTSSSFDGCDLRDSAIGTWHDGQRNTWRQVRFRGANLRGALALGAHFEACDFSDAVLEGVEFQQSTLRGCQFSGVVKDVVFDCRDLPGKPLCDELRDVDFSRASFEDVEFRGCRFQGVRLPQDPGLLVVPQYPRVAQRALELLAGDTSVEARMLIGEWQNELRLPGRPDSVGVFNRRDYLAAGGDTLAELAETTVHRALDSISADRG